MKIYIYIIWFSASKKYYVGQTYDLKGRMFAHLNNNSLVGKALNKYDDWQISILHTCKTRDEANRIEIEEIRNFNSVAPNGYNLTRGGDSGGMFRGHHHIKEWKRTYSENNPMKDPRIAAKISVVMKGNKRAQGKNNGMKNPQNVLKMLYARCKNKLEKLEQELESN